MGKHFVPILLAVWACMYLLAAFVKWDMLWITDIAAWSEFARYIMLFVIVGLGGLCAMLICVIRDE